MQRALKHFQALPPLRTSPNFYQSFHYQSNGRHGGPHAEHHLNTEGLLFLNWLRNSSLVTFSQDVWFP
ncbi:hypothetical protein E2C01_078609 [Portunus trituberculatus]|uniref:Uncharacterized protein n=1 Tax=Portunus trituberculatus TaxID=210409 RepID=A0A5B7IT74_PORTR|nr:hypothetical protein [Portunus trituberculatus]